MKTLRLVHLGKDKFCDLFWEGGELEIVTGAIGTKGRARSLTVSPGMIERVVEEEIAKRRKQGFEEVAPDLLPAQQAALSPTAPARPNLLAQIAAAPTDDGPRLVYADHLSSHGDPRGEFIVVQCERARLDRWAPEQGKLAEREETLLLGMRETWFPLGDPHVTPTFARGFVDRVRVEAVGAAPTLLDRIFELAPLLRTLEMQGPPPSQFGSIGALARLSGLVVRPPLHGWSFESLMAAPAFANLRRLAMRNCGLDPRALRSLDKRAWTELDFDHAVLGANGLKVVLERLDPDSIETLAVANTGLGTGVAHLTSTAYPRLRKLGLRDNRLAAQSSEALARLQCPALEVLDLSNNDMSALAFGALALPALRELSLHGASITDDTLDSLVDSALPARLVALDLGDNSITEAGVAKLASVAWPQLRYLNLGKNYFERSAARSVLSERMPHAQLVLRRASADE